MTITRALALTGVSAALYIALAITFADGLFTGAFFGRAAVTGSTWLTYALLAAIIIGGVFQANRIPEAGITVGLPTIAGRTRQQAKGSRSLAGIMGRVRLNSLLNRPRQGTS